MLGIVAVAGNVPLALTERNARTVCELAGRPEVPVYAGCERPMHRSLVTAEYIHGKTGLDGPVLPEPTMKLQPEHGVDYLIETLRRAEVGGITLCTLGPLTNVGMALVKAPNIVPKVREIRDDAARTYFEVGPTPRRPIIYVDPHAADLVLRSGIPVTIIPLDVSHKALTTAPRIARFRALGTRCGRAVAGDARVLRAPRCREIRRRRRTAARSRRHRLPPRPDLYSGRRVNVKIETASPLTLGMTVADWWRVTDRPPNAQFMNDVDADGFYDLLTERIATLP